MANDDKKNLTAYEVAVELKPTGQIVIPDETVEQCLRLIEWWLKDNPDKTIRGGTRLADGTIEELKICDWSKSDDVCKEL